MSHPEFPLEQPIIYLNHAAVAPWPLRTTEAVQNFAMQNSHHGSRFYPQWLNKERQLKQQLKNLLNAPDINDIALVKNTSEALSFVAYGLRWQNRDNIVSSAEEFPSNRIVWESLKNQGVEFRQADLQNSRSPEQALFDLVDSNTRLLSISSIQFASGLRLDLHKIGAFCRENNILFCIDAIQSLGCVGFDAQAYQADFVMADGHKWMFGPEGLGVFYTSPTAREQLQLTQYGWHMMADTHNYENKPWDIHPGSQRFECGSPNMLGIHALSASLSLLLETGMDKIEQQVIDNCDYLKQQIQQAKNLTLLSPPNPALKSGIVLFKHKNLDNQPLFRYLSDKGVACAQRGQGIRYSPHFYNDRSELAKAVQLADQAE